jgi:hypothetical protein
VKFSFATLLAQDSWSKESWPKSSLKDGVSDQIAKSVEELAVVRAQPQARFHVSLCIAPSFANFSHDKKVLCGI